MTKPSTHTIDCPYCNGTGEESIDGGRLKYRCPDCYGDGTIELCDECCKDTEDCQCEIEDGDDEETY